MALAPLFNYISSGTTGPVELNVQSAPLCAIVSADFNGYVAEYIYLQSAGAYKPGTVCAHAMGIATAAALTTPVGTPLVFATRAMAANDYSWFLLSGPGVILSAADVVADTVLQISAAGTVGGVSLVLNYPTILGARVIGQASTTTSTARCTVKSMNGHYQTVYPEDPSALNHMFEGMTLSSAVGFVAGQYITKIHHRDGFFEVSADAAITTTADATETITFTFTSGTDYWPLITVDRARLGMPGTATVATGYTTAGAKTWTKPVNCLYFDVFMVGGGGGGGSGRKGAAGSHRFGGGGGSAGGVAHHRILGSMIGATMAAVVGAAGTGGASLGNGATGNTTNGNNGVAGGATTCTLTDGTVLTALGGNLGGGGTDAAGAAGAAVNCFHSWSGVTLAGQAGGAANVDAKATQPTAITFLAPTGGGAGGSIDHDDGTEDGGDGGTTTCATLGTPPTGKVGSTDGTAGIAGTTYLDLGFQKFGLGGSGGGCSAAAASGAGGAGAAPGGGGGGGGATLNGQNSSAGGAGGVGYLYILATCALV